MLTPYEQIRLVLVTRPQITAVVGQRVFKAQIPQAATLPLALITGVAGIRSHDLQMRGTDRQRISIECRSTLVDGPTGANTLGALVIEALDGASLSGIELVELVGDVTLYEDSSKTVRRIVDFHAHMSA
jgi:Protein of unknown function (DUF3168)